MADEPELSVVIVNFDGRQHLEECLAAVTAQEVPGGAEVLLVDNGSRDGSAEFVRTRFPGVRILALGANRGFAGGNNAGIRAARGRHVALLNNDTRARPGWAAALLGALAAGDRVGAVTSKLLFMDDPGTIQNAGGVLLSDGSGGDRGSGEPDGGAYAQPDEVFGFNGAAALLNRQALEDCGVFDERFFMYYEDTDLSWRMRLRGWRILFEPAAVVEHAHAASSREWSPFFTFHVDRNRLFMVLKNARASFVARSFTSLGLRAVRRGRGAGGSARRGRPSIHLRVLASLLWHLPGLLWSRVWVRGRRRVPDSEIERWLVSRQDWDARSG